MYVGVAGSSLRSSVRRLGMATTDCRLLAGYSESEVDSEMPLVYAIEYCG